MRLPYSMPMPGMQQKGGKMKGLLMLAIACSLILSSCGSETAKDSDRLVIMASSFPSYDAARAIAGDRAELTMLVPPGSDTHSFDPSVLDAMKIENCDLFIYTGGESDAWLAGLSGNAKASFRLIDHVPVILYETETGIIEAEEEHDHQHERVADEHVWTSLTNEIAIISSLCDELCRLDPGSSDYYKANAAAYISSLEELRAGFQAVVDSAERREIVVADRFPLLYFASEFGLDWYAAFPGCASQSEPSARTVSALIDKVREDEIPVVFHMELSNTLLSSVIASETGAEVRQFNSCHMISKRDFDAGLTYVDAMRSNLRNLEEALN